MKNIVQNESEKLLETQITTHHYESERCTSKCWCANDGKIDLIIQYPAIFMQTNSAIAMRPLKYNEVGYCFGYGVRYHHTIHRFHLSFAWHIFHRFCGCFHLICHSRASHTCTTVYRISLARKYFAITQSRRWHHGNVNYGVWRTKKTIHHCKYPWATVRGIFFSFDSQNMVE